MKVNTIIKPQNKTQQLYDEASAIVYRTRLAARTGQLVEVADDARRILKKIGKMDFNRLSAELCSFLQYYYYRSAFDRRKGKKYEELYYHYAHLANIEEDLQIKYARISHKLDATIYPSPGLKKELRDLCTASQPHLELHNASISIIIYTLMTFDALVQKKRKEYIRICESAIEFIQRKAIRRELHFYGLLAPALIQEKAFDKAADNIHKAKSLTQRGSNNYYRFLYYEILSQLHQGHYQQAHDLYIPAAGKLADKPIAEQFLLLKGYFAFLQRNGTIQSNSRFQLYKFLNEVPLFSKDKSGHNVNILILQILYYLGKDHSRIIDKIDAIEVYRLRYLYGRSSIFLKMLWKMIHYKFNPIAITNRTSQDVKKLNAVPLNIDSEVIPYEQLWEIVMAHLRRGH